jgi:RNase P protein component
MLKKRLRLGSQEVEQVMKAGRSARSAHLQVKFVAGPGPLRSAAVAPKSLARKAIARNTLRRALYRALAATTIGLKGNAVFFVRVVPKEKPAAVFAQELPALVTSLLSK